jgi:hypothetical protein
MPSDPVFKIHLNIIYKPTDKKGHPGPPGWGFGVGPTTPHSKKLIVMKVEQRKKLNKCNDGGQSW